VITTPPLHGALLCALRPASRCAMLCALLLAAASSAPAAQPAEGICDPKGLLLPLRDEDPAVNKLLASYNLPPTPFRWRLALQQHTPHYRVYHLTFPSPVKTPVPENNTVHAEYYLPARMIGKQPAALVLHILDGRFLVARAVCRYFAGSGTPALMVMMPFYGPRRPKDRSIGGYYLAAPKRVFESMHATVLECRLATCWLQQRPEVDPQRVGLVGVSLGAITGGLLAGVDPRFARNVLVLGGGDPARILWHAHETHSVRERLEQLGYTLDKIREATVAIDPIRFAKRIDPKTMLFINARYDQTVPRDCTERLWKAMGKPAIEWLPAGHYSASLYIPVILPQAHHFVRHGAPPPTPTGRNKLEKGNPTQ